MLTAVAERPVRSGGLVDQGNFSIKATGKAFRILSDGLYSDKPLAVIRELSCNAYDAHIAAGRGDVPFTIHLPNQLEPHLSVRDDGVGLSHDGVMRLYTTYFESTKTDSNDFIGALGLGSKSPFSYVDSFTVVSRFKGTKRTYTAYISENGVPSIAFMGEELTNEHNGLEVSMPVQSKDFSTFIERAQRVLNRFKPSPTIVGASITLDPVDYGVRGSCWAVRKNHNKTEYQHGRGYVPDVYAIQGSVAYKIDRSAMQNLSKDESAILDLPVDIEFPIGELEVAASREGLSYDKRTIENIKKRLNIIKAEFASTYAKEFMACKTLWEAKLKFSQVVGGLSSNLKTMLGSAIQFQGVPIKDTLVSTENAKASFVYLGSRVLKKVKWPLNYQSHISLNAKDDIWIVYNDRTVRNVSARLKHAYEQESPRPSEIVVINAVDDAAFVETLEELGSPPFLKISDYPDPPKVVGQRRSVKKVYRYDVGAYGRHSFVEHQQDVSKGGLYLNLTNWKVRSPRGHEESTYTFTTALRLAEELGYGIVSDDVCFFPATHKNIPIKNPGWELLWDRLKANLQKTASPRFLDKMAVISAWQQLCNIPLIKLAGSIKSSDSNSVFGAFAAEVSRVSALSKPNKETEAWEGLNNLLGSPVKVPELATTLPEFLATKLRAKYPLLVRLASGYEDKSALQEWTDYINSCNR